MESFGGKQALEDSISKVKADTFKEQIENIEEISFNNKTIPLKTEKIKQAFKRFHLIKHDIELLKE